MQHALPIQRRKPGYSSCARPFEVLALRKQLQGGFLLIQNFFLTELLEVLEVIDLPKLEPLIEKLFKRLIKCITGKNAAVTDKTLQYLENENFTTILKHYKKTVFPWLVPVINLIVNKHWHKCVLFFVIPESFPRACKPPCRS